MEEETKEVKKLSKGEIAWISIEGVVAALGLFFLVIGILVDYVPPKRNALGEYSNWMLNWQNGFQTWSKTTLSLRWLGIIILLIAVFVTLITLNHYAKKSDVNDERALRRAQRLQVLSQSAPEEPKVVDVPAAQKPAEPAAPVAPTTK
jgi:hypothetical protein